MRIFEPKIPYTKLTPQNFFERYAGAIEINNDNKPNIFQVIMEAIRIQDQKQFYPLIEELFGYLGFNCKATRAGDTNNRSDAYIIDDEHSIPIEIKSPTEVLYINNKSIRQAIENKTILLSRKFYNTNYTTTSLAVGFSYPADRSGVYDLVEDVYKAYGYNIGFISINDILEVVWDVLIKGREFNKERIIFLKGEFKCEN
ncbi:hypothetical protein FAM09_03435 [Niastella caeni]|uniref:Restriction endonuclease n=1 Tax=Niastella caeni TaxID=2569763 RepID=A0A4S8I1T5_9BACT|nr:hypothetical protein [Niastella caeni]THU41179.1 hypothetical protein FAM09_03435 [Niastella caeni]